MLQRAYSHNQGLGPGQLYELYVFAGLRERLPDPESYLESHYPWLAEPAPLSPEGGTRQRILEMDRLRRKIALARALELFRSAGFPSQPGDGDRIIEGPQGKPALLRADGSIFSSFNTSSRADRVIVAFGHEQGCQVGVDLEDLQRDISASRMDAVLEYYFTPEERADVRGNPHPRIRYLELWSRKEAAVKCLGLSVGSHGPAVRSLEPVWFEHAGTRAAGCTLPPADDRRWIISLASDSPVPPQPGAVKSIEARFPSEP